MLNVYTPLGVMKFFCKMGIDLHVSYNIPTNTDDKLVQTSISRGQNLFFILR